MAASLLQKLKANGDVVGICVSGGLDSKTVALKLRHAGVQVKCFTADIGQPDEDDISDVVKKMDPCGVKTWIVDLKTEIAEAAFECVAAQATYDGGYWQSTGLGRYVTVRGLIKKMREEGVTVLAHGCTGRGNDQVRFERYVNVIDPSFNVYAPWRDPELLTEFPGRSEMLAYLQKHGIGHQIVSQTAKRYSTDANICGLSNEAEDLESIETAMTIVNPVMGVWPKDAPDVQEDVVLKFKGGRCVAINGKEMEPLQVLEAANKIAGRNGIGISHALENRILGTKSRGVYEAPGMELLGKCLTYVYQAVLDRRSTGLFSQLSSHISDQIYDGRYFDPSTRTAITGVWGLAEAADGTVKVGLYKGHMHFLALTECPHSIYFEADSSMEASSGLNPVSSQGYLEVSSVEAKSMAKAGLIETSSVWEKMRGKTATGGVKRKEPPSTSSIAATPSSKALLEGLKGRHLKRIDDYSAPEFEAMLAYSRRLKTLAKADQLPDRLMSQKSVAMIFQKRSTRTRVSTETGMTLMGGHALFLSSQDIQLGQNESVADTSCVLSRFNSLILARVYGHSTIEELCQHCTVPVINALSDMHHPLQILADFVTLQEHFGENLKGKTLAWVGDGNNVVHDIMLAAPLMGMNMHIATPKGYECDAKIIADTKALAAKHGTVLLLTTKPEEAVNKCDVAITDTWVSMGQEEESAKRIRDFAGYQITMDLMKRGGANPGWRFLHCLPRHKEEVDDEVFYSKERSLIWDEAENRMWTVMAVMSTMLGKIA
jgi:argininosuccinate synthase